MLNTHTTLLSFEYEKLDKPYPCSVAFPPSLALPMPGTGPWNGFERATQQVGFRLWIDRPKFYGSGPFLWRSGTYFLLSTIKILIQTRSLIWIRIRILPTVSTLTEFHNCFKKKKHLWHCHGLLYTAVSNHITTLIAVLLGTSTSYQFYEVRDKQ
jgi:hypothetical protein